MTTKKRVLISALFFLLGALPLLIFNVREHGATFRGNFVRDTASIPAKLRFLADSVDGGLFGWMTMENWQTPQPHEPQGLLQAASMKISMASGQPRKHFFLYAFALAVLLAPFSGRKGLRTILFALIAMAIAWIQMAINASTGGSVHHTVLLWPLPTLIVAVSLAGASHRIGRAGKPALAAIMAVLTVSCVLVMNEYYVSCWRFGGAPAWTDAIFRLSDRMAGTSAKTILCMDWGILDQLRLLGGGKLPLKMGSELVSNPEELGRTLAGDGQIFVAHTKPFEFFAGNMEKLTKAAAEAGYRSELIETIPDNYGRPVYEVYRFVPLVSRLFHGEGAEGQT